MKNNVFSLKIFIFWKIFIRGDKIEIKSVQNCALKTFSFENFDFWDFLFLFRRLRVTLGAMRHSWGVILCGLKITNHSIWDMIDKISRTQKRLMVGWHLILEHHLSFSIQFFVILCSSKSSFNKNTVISPKTRSFSRFENLKLERMKLERLKLERLKLKRLKLKRLKRQLNFASVFPT